jgi:hypothetical protein
MLPPEVLEALARLVVSERLRKTEVMERNGDWGNKMSCSSEMHIQVCFSRRTLSV